MIDLKTAGLKIYLRDTLAKVKHHAKYAEPILGNLLLALILHADEGSIEQWGGSERQGVVTYFRFRGVRFKLKGDRIKQKVVLLRRDGTLVAMFDTADPIEEKFRQALKHATRKSVRIPYPPTRSRLTVTAEDPMAAQ